MPTSRCATSPHRGPSTGCEAFVLAACPRCDRRAARRMHRQVSREPEHFAKVIWTRRPLLDRRASCVGRRSFRSSLRRPSSDTGACLAIRWRSRGRADCGQWSCDAGRPTGRLHAERQIPCMSGQARSRQSWRQGIRAAKLRPSLTTICLRSPEVDGRALPCSRRLRAPDGWRVGERRLTMRRSGASCRHSVTHALGRECTVIADVRTKPRRDLDTNGSPWRVF
jgi:hypothetical protein